MKDPKILSRISIFYAAMLIVGGLIIGQVAYLQFFAKDKSGERYSEKAKQISISKRNIRANRGSILSHDERLLATSLPTYVLRMDFRAAGMTDSIFNSNVRPLAQALATKFRDKSVQEYEKALRNARKEAKGDAKKRIKRIVSKKVNYLELQDIKKFPLYEKGKNVGGLIAEQESRRIYPYEGLAYRTIGYLNADNGGTGIERAFDEHLKGVEGRHIIQRTAGGEYIPIDSDENIEPKDGCDIVTTIDVDMQDAAETALRNQLMKGEGYFEAGTVIVMETKTGAIRAMANMKRRKDGTFGENYNYAIAEATEPGSTFKLASLIAVLESGSIDIDDEIDCGTTPHWKYKDFTFHESGSKALGKTTVQTIIEKSSNVGVAKMVLKAFEGKESKFTDYLYKMKLNEKLGLDIDGEATPRVKNPKTDSKIWSAYSMPQMAIGYEIQLAPIHTLTFYNAVANGGKMVRPKLINEIRRNGRVEELFATQVLRESICSKKTLAKVHTVLSSVVERGTAKNAFIDAEYKVAGKTGTAQMAFGNKGYVQNGMKRHQASFCGYFPADNPQFTCVVVLYTDLIPRNSNFYGATWAAPVFREVADKIYATHPVWFSPVTKPKEYFTDLPKMKKGKCNEVIEVARKLDLPHVTTDVNTDWALVTFNGGKSLDIKGEQQSKNVVPSVVGMGLKDAIYLLESIGMKVSFQGKGFVTSQSVAAGEKFGRGQRIALVLDNNLANN